jgi:hypothetical protein
VCLWERREIASPLGELLKRIGELFKYKSDHDTTLSGFLPLITKYKVSTGLSRPYMSWPSHSFLTSDTARSLHSSHASTMQACLARLFFGGTGVLNARLHDYKCSTA